MAPGCSLIRIRVDVHVSMMMEQTHLFQATVRTIRLKMKNQKREESSGVSSGSDTSSILMRKTRRKTEFAKEAVEVVRDDHCWLLCPLMGVSVSVHPPCRQHVLPSFEIS